MTHSFKIKQRGSKKHSLLSVTTSGLARTPDAPGVMYSLNSWLGYFHGKTGETLL